MDFGAALVRLTGANVDDSRILEDMLDAIPAIGGKPGHPRSRPENAMPIKAMTIPAVGTPAADD